VRVEQTSSSSTLHCGSKHRRSGALVH